MNNQADTVRKAEQASRNLPVACSPPSGPQSGGSPHGPRTAIDPGFAAHLLGAAGQRRGLKGGAPVLQAARRAYLTTEWSGGGDRRADPGALGLKRI